MSPSQLNRSEDYTPWLKTETIEAAEHIPAPKTFKRGDRVRKMVKEDCGRAVAAASAALREEHHKVTEYRDGIVLACERIGTTVHWPGKDDEYDRVQIEDPDALELEEPDGDS